MMNPLEEKTEHEYELLDRQLKMLEHSTGRKYLFRNERYPDMLEDETFMGKLDSFVSHYTRFRSLMRFSLGTCALSLIPTWLNVALPDIGKEVVGFIDRYGSLHDFIFASLAVCVAEGVLGMVYWNRKVHPSEHALTDHALRSGYVRMH